MLDDRIIIYITLVLGILYSALVVIFCNKIADRLGVVDHPGAQDHKVHGAPTPLIGGLAALPPAITILLLQFFQEGILSTHAAPFLALALASLASLVVGFLDDRRHIRAIIRLIASSCVFCVAILISPEFIVSALDFQGISFKIELGLLAIPFSVFCLLAFQNAVNMADGRNGLVAGIAIIWLLTLLSYGWHPLTLAIASLVSSMLIVLGANLGGRLFLGDGGSYGIGAFVGLATIWVHRSNIGMHTIDVVIMFLVPALDMFRLFIFRIFEGRNPFSADHCHLHHYLDRSVGWMLGRKIYYAIVAIPIFFLRLELLEPLYILVLGAAGYSACLVFGMGVKRKHSA